MHKLLLKTICIGETSLKCIILLSCKRNLNHHTGQNKSPPWADFWPDLTASTPGGQLSYSRIIINTSSHQQGISVSFSISEQCLCFMTLLPGLLCISCLCVLCVSVLHAQAWRLVCAFVRCRSPVNRERWGRCSSFLEVRSLWWLWLSSLPSRSVILLRSTCLMKSTRLWTLSIEKQCRVMTLGIVDNNLTQILLTKDKAYVYVQNDPILIKPVCF